jgi:hypothetical protein
MSWKGEIRVCPMIPGTASYALKRISECKERCYSGLRRHEGMERRDAKCPEI